MEKEPAWPPPKRWMISASRYIDVAAGGIFLVGYLCPYVPPETFWWTGLAAIALPFTSCLLAVLTVPLLMERPIRKSLVTVHVLVLALLVVRFIHPASWLGNAEPGGDDLVIMTQNLPSASIERARTSSFKLLEVVRRIDPHLIGIQEGIVMDVDSGRYRSTKEEKFRVLLDSLYYDTKPVPIESTGMMPAWHDPVLFRIPIENQRQIELEYPAHPLEEPLRLVRTELTWQGRKLIHYNIHLATYGTSKPWRSIRGRAPFSPYTIVEYLREIRSGFIRRAWEVRRIRTMMEGEMDPVIVSGDFNCTPNNWAYRHLAVGFQDAWMTSGTGWGATYHSAFPIWRIDYVLLSTDFQPVSTEVLPVSTDVSDHRTLVARLRWRNGDTDS